MLQTKHDLFHRQAPFADDTRRREQDETCHQPQYQVPIVGVFAGHLTGLGRQEMLQRPKDQCDPVTPPPPPDQLRRAHRRFQTQQVQAVLSRFVHDDHGDRSIGLTLSPQARVAHPRLPGMITPGPIRWLKEVTSLDPPSIGQGKHRGTLALHQQETRMLTMHMPHQLRVAQPTLSYHHRSWQLQAAAFQGSQALSEHGLHPGQLVATGPPRAFGVGPADGKVHRHDQLAITNDYDQQHSVNARSRPLFLAAPPGPDSAQLPAILFEDGIIHHPRPLPATERGRALVLDMAPQRHQNLSAQAPQPLQPGARRQGAEHLRRQVLVPAPHAAQFIRRATAKERREHEAKDFAQQCLLTSQAAFDLLDEVVGQAQVVEGLFEGLEGTLSLSAVVLEALVGFLAATLSGLRVFFSVSFSRGHGELLRLVMTSIYIWKSTMPHQGSDCKPESENTTPHSRGVSISPL